LLNSYSTTVVFPKPAAEIVKKWQLATEGDLAHVVVMQNHCDSKIDDLIFDLISSLGTNI
jgi:histidine decarboxylase